MGRTTVAQMRRVLALRSQGVTDVVAIQRQAQASWWIAELYLEELLGWLEIDENGQPLAMVDDLYWHAPTEAGPGWRLTYDEAFAIGDSFKVLAHRDRTPPSSRKGVVKLDGDAVVGEYVFYRLARWLGLPSAPVQIVEVPPEIPTRWEWERANLETPDASMSHIVELLEQMNVEVRSHRRAGALIWWIDSADDGSLWSGWDDPRAVGLIALAAAGESVESPEFRRAAVDGTPFLVDNQYAFREFWLPESGVSRIAVERWAERVRAVPKAALDVVRTTWQRLAELETRECMRIMGIVPIEGLSAEAIHRGWSVTQQRARALVEASR